MAMTSGNLEKAAAMLVSLGLERGAQVLSHLAPEEVQQLARQMAQTGRIQPSRRKELLQELRSRVVPSDLEAMGGLDFVRHLLSQSFGEQRAIAVLDQLNTQKAPRPFSSLRLADPRRILDVIASERPSVIALVIYYLPREKAAAVFAGLAETVRHEVVMRLVNLQRPQPQMVARLEQVITQNLNEIEGSEEGDREYGQINGARTLVEILGRVDTSVERQVYEFLQERDPELAEEVRKSMFVFEDIAKLDRNALRMVLLELSAQEIATSLKGSGESLKELIFSNVSQNTAKTIQEELELLGPVRVKQVEEAQQKIIAVVRRLAENGAISLHGASEEDEFIN